MKSETGVSSGGNGVRVNALEASRGPHFLTVIKNDQLGSGLGISYITFRNALIESFVRFHQAQNLQVVLLLREHINKWYHLFAQANNRKRKVL